MISREGLSPARSSAACSARPSDGKRLPAYVRRTWQNSIVRGLVGISFSISQSKKGTYVCQGVDYGLVSVCSSSAGRGKIWCTHGGCEK